MARSLSNPHNFVPGQLYRLSKTLDDPALRGRVVSFKKWVHYPWDIRRAVVHLVKEDGGLGEEWLVNPYFVIPL